MPAWPPPPRAVVPQPAPEPQAPPAPQPTRSAFEKRERPPAAQLRIRTRKRTGSPLHPAAEPSDAARPDRAPSDGGDTLQGHGRRVADLVAQGRIHEADEHIAAHAAGAQQADDVLARRDAAAWAVMRALLDGRHRDARHQLEDVLRLGREAGDPAAEDVHAWQRFWLLTEWGSEAELEELLDYCRQRSYFNNELRWRAALTLLLARMGYAQESAREFDTVMRQGLNGLIHDGEWLDLMTNAGEAAAILGDTHRARIAYGALGRSSTTTAVVGRAWVCKGSTARVVGLLADTVGRPTESDRHFATAMDKHRNMEALPLLARTCTEWGLRLAAREPQEADQYLDEGFELAGRLGMTGLATTARAGLDGLRQPVAS